MRGWPSARPVAQPRSGSGSLTPAQQPRVLGPWKPPGPGSTTEPRPGLASAHRRWLLSFLHPRQSRLLPLNQMEFGAQTPLWRGAGGLQGQAPRREVTGSPRSPSEAAPSCDPQASSAHGLPGLRRHGVYPTK